MASLLIDRELALDILDAINLLTAPERGLAQECYRTLRMTQWEAVMRLRLKLENAIKGGLTEIAMTEDEVALAGTAVECADIFAELEAGETTELWERVATVVGVGGGILGIIAFFG